MTEHRCLGVVQIGTWVIAIPAAELETVSAEARPIVPLPDAPPFLLGLVARDDHTTVPVVDLLALLNPGQPRSVQPKLLVFLQTPAGRLALAADAVSRVVTPRPEQFVQIKSLNPAHPSLFCEAFTEGQNVINVLNLEALTGFAGVRVSVAPPQSETTHSAPTILRTVFQCDDLIFAVDAAVTAGARLVPKLTATNLPSRLLHGFFDHQGAQLALISLRRLLALPTATPDAAQPDQMLVLRHEGRAFGFGVSQVLGLEAHPDQPCQRIAACGFPEAGLYRGTLQSPRFGRVLVLDHEALFSNPGLRNLVSLHDCAAAQLAQDRANAITPTTFITYRAGHHLLATRMTDLEAVLPYPQDFSRLGQPQDIFQGLCNWKDQVLGVVDLSAVLGEPLQAPDPTQARVLVVRTDQDFIGYLVPRVEALVDRIPKPRPHFAAAGHPAPSRAGHVPTPTEMVTVSSQAGSHNAPILELKRIVPAPQTPTTPQLAVSC